MNNKLPWMLLCLVVISGVVVLLVPSPKTPLGDVYPYYCQPDGQVFVIPSVNMNTLVIQPVGGTKFPPKELVASHPVISGEEMKDRYQKGDITITTKEKEITISSPQTSITCAPMPYTEYPPLTFGR